MKKSKIFIAICFAIVININKVNAQITYTNNDNAGPPGSFVGWDNSVGGPLEVRHDANQPILFSTNGNENMEIAEYGNVGVGNFGQLIRPKFYVRLSDANASTNPFLSIGIIGANEFSGTEANPVNRGVQGFSFGTNSGIFTENYGGDFYARMADVNYGVQGAAGIPNGGNEIVGEQGYGVVGISERHSEVNIGVFGRAACPDGFLNAWTVGVLGTAGPENCNDAWACWFEGDTYSTSGTWNASDQAFKTNVENIEDALEVINQLQPKSYFYNTGSYSSMNFPSGMHYGLIAQELEEVLPTLVKDVYRGARHDSLGNEIVPMVDFKAVNYSELIPIMLAGIKEQQSIIDAQNELLVQVLERLDNVEQCCNINEFRSTSTGKGASKEQIQEEKSSGKNNELYQNIPNPFRESTTISYLLEDGGRVQLSIYDKTGKVVTTLTDATQGPGRYSVVWNANGMPSGVYHYALYVDGELLVKRAIKLQD